MKLTMQLIRNWIRDVAQGVLPQYKVIFVNENLPRELRSKVLYIVQEDGFVEHAAMLCPCKCGNVLQMNLLPDERPCWNLEQKPDGTPTLYPSVWRKVECESHFWLRGGRIFWVS